MSTISICFIAIFIQENHYVYELAKRLSEAGYKIDIICGRWEPSVPQINNRNLRIHYIDSVNSFNYGKKALFKLLEIGIRPDVIHGSDIFYYSLIRQIPFTVRFVGTIHNSYRQRFQAAEWVRKPIYIPLMMRERRVCLDSHAIIVPSPNTKEALQRYGVPNHKIHTIFYGVDTKVFSPKKRGRLRKRLHLSDEPIILFVGRLVQRKHPESLLTALSSILIFMPKAQIVFIGDGKLKNKLIQKNIQNRLQNVHFIGNVNPMDMPEYYGDADIFFLQSFGEGLPFVLLEAAASELPLIVSGDATGGTSIVRNGYNGFIIDTAEPRKISQCIVAAFKSKNQFGSRSRNIVRRDFTWDICLTKTVDVYRQILK